MGLAAGQLIADLHQEDTAVLLGDQVLPLLGGLIRVLILQLLGGDEEDVLRQAPDGMGIFVPDLVLHVLDDLEEPADHLF